MERGLRALGCLGAEEKAVEFFLAIYFLKNNTVRVYAHARGRGHLARRRRGTGKRRGKRRMRRGRKRRRMEEEIRSDLEV